MANIVVVGSSNTDLVVRVPRIPQLGETIIGENLSMVPGGKGANQAVAAARLGAKVTFVGCFGTDAFGHSALQSLRSEGIDTQYADIEEQTPSGVALIAVDARGKNAIVVAPGANMHLYPADVERAEEAIAQADVVLAQLEIPPLSVERAFELARQYGARTILNPAPAQALSERLLALTDIITPNELEARQLTNARPSATPEEIAKMLHDLGIPTVVLTLAERGAILLYEDGLKHFPAMEVQAIDSTAAGDAFAGGFAVALAEGMEPDRVMRFANAVAGLSVMRPGAQPSMPTRDEVNAVLGW